jgi:1-phosphatidylinositol-3-phosphate 5-kinase
MVRVCNLCVEKLAKVDDDDDDDRRSIVSSVLSFPAHQFGLDSIGLGHHPQSPFAASQLFSRTDEPFNLYSIAETKRPRSYSDEGGFGSRPITPHKRDRSEIWEAPGSNPAPFRRALSDEDTNAEDISNPFSTDQFTHASSSKTPIDFPIMGGAGDTSSIQFPVGSPDPGHDMPDAHRFRGHFNSYADFEAATPFIRSRVQSRLDGVAMVEPGWRTRRESTA